MTIRIGINGFGRIGRLVTRASQGTDIQVVAVNDLVPAPNLAYMLKYDSVHGRFDGTVESTDNSIIANDTSIQTFSQHDPAQLPWGELGVDYVLEATGFFTTQLSPGGAFSHRDTHFRLSFATPRDRLEQGLDVLAQLLQGG